MHLRLGVVVSSLVLLSLAVPCGPADASNPQLVVAGHDDHGEGEEVPPTAASALGSIPCTNGFADIYPCQGVDLLGFVPLLDLGDSRAAGIWGWTDPQTRREYALIALSSRASFVDITDPGQPRILGYLPSHNETSTGNREISVYRDHAFVVADGAVGDHGIQIFDLTQLRNARGPQVRFTPTVRYTGVNRVHTLFINTETGFAYANGSDQCEGGVHMIDVRNPRRPVFAGCFASMVNNSTYVHDIQCVIYRGPDSRFRGREICFASNPRSLQIVDVTDKGAPRLLGQADYPNSGYMHQGWLTEDQRYFLMDDELDESRGLNTTTHLWDVSDLTAPNRFAVYTANTKATDHNQFVRGGFVYQGNYRAGLRILDLARIGDGVLTEAAYFDTVPDSDNPGFSGAWGLYPYYPSGNIAVSSIDRGLFVVRHTAGSSFPGPVPTVCRRGQDRLCLLGNRYLVDVSWRNQFNGTGGSGRARQASDLAGYFSFGDPSNLELMVKVLDFGGEVRFFYGQLTNLEVKIRVVDTKTGQMREYANGPNNCGAITALPGSSTASPLGLLTAHAFDFAKPGRGIPATADLGGDIDSVVGAHETGSCKPGKNRLCLGHRRFQVEVDWRNQFDGTSGPGHAAALSELTGSFAFQEPRNVELLVKVLEFGDRELVLWGALSNLEYTLKVTDTKTGAMKTWHNPAGTYCGGVDQDAF